jgi:D-3-phosphoglycerate dehydrogenase
MKSWHNKLTIKRTSTSPYFSSEFNLNERETLSPYVEMLESSTLEYTDIFITNTHTNFDLFNYEQLEKLKLIIHPNSGYDNIPLDFVKAMKAPIIIGSPIRAQAVSQYIMSALLNHFSPIPSGNQWDWDRKWPRRILTEVKVLIIGFGHIGKILNAALTPLVKELVIYDPFENKTQLDNKQADVVILACGLNSKSRHIVDKSFLNSIKENALIINAARGELIKTSDLINFLTANDDAYAVLDVFEKEPNDFSDFRHLKNVRLTSHIAGVFKNIDQCTINFEFNVLKDFHEMTEFDFKNKYQKLILQNKLKVEIGLI